MTPTPFFPAAAATAGVTAALVAACAAAPSLPPPPALRLAECQLPDVEQRVLCGELQVPETRSAPGGTRIALNVVILRAAGPRTLPPLYHLEGGPGVPGTGAAGFYATAGAGYWAHRDLVLIDQRGTGASAPLACPVYVKNPFAPVLDAMEVAACRQRLAATADLPSYSTPEGVRDVEALRQALGHERIDLIGLSYGTRVAQEYLRAYPERVRALALLGAVSPEDKLPLGFAPAAARVLDRLAQQCTADRACRKAVPDLARDVATLQARLKKAPVPVKLPGGEIASLQAGPFWEAVRALLATTTGQRRLPWLLHEAARDRFEPLLQVIAPHREPGSNAALLAISCPEDTLHITDAEIAASDGTVFGRYRVDQQLAACQAWGVPALPGTRPGFVTFDRPVLLMHGELDHATPVKAAHDIAAHLPHARVVVVPGLGHFPDGLTHMECYDDIVNRFFEAGSAAGLDLSCVAQMQPPAFELGKKGSESISPN